MHRPLPHRWLPGSCSAGLGAALQSRIDGQEAIQVDCLLAGKAQVSAAAAAAVAAAAAGGNQAALLCTLLNCDCPIDSLFAQKLLQTAVCAERSANSGNLNRVATAVPE